MKNLLWLLFAPGLALAPSLARAGAPAPLARQAKAILQAHCASCHGGGKAVKGGFGFVLDRDRLVGRLLVTPGKASQSDLYTRVQQGEMPPKSSKTRPSATDIQTLACWIDAGAPAFDGAPQATKPLTSSEVSAAILADLQSLDPRRHRFTRYLTLSHLASGGRSTRELDATREAAGKLVNSLSWHARITRPETVDPGGTILRLDLRAYKWTATQWDRLVAAYPYRMQTAAEANALAGYTGTEFPALRADWFVATASRPPLYQELLQLPTTDRALERLLQVDVTANIQDDNILRAGFNDSGVSKNNRMLERHDAAYGAYWRSYDFANNTGRQNIFEHPLGPLAGATSFQPAGGEMIFHLPNGLQAYMLVDAKGRRIDKGPTEIVADPRRPDQRVETGISCMSCHARGLLPKADQVRGHVEKNAAVFGKQIVAAIRAAHPRKARFQAQIDEDNVRYLRVLEVFGVRDPDQEPINVVTQRFEGTLDGPAAAAELGFTVDELTAFFKRHPEQTRLFGSLLVKGGTAQRGVFQDNFPELARRTIAFQSEAIARTKPRLDAAFEGHTATVNAVAFSTDGERAASGSDDRTVRVWAIPSGQLLMTLTSDNMAEVYAVAFSADGKFLLSAGRDRVVRLWDLGERKQIRIFRGHTDSIRALAVSPDGKRAVSGSDDRTVRVWDVKTGDQTAALTGHTGSVTSVAWSLSGAHVLSGSRDAAVRWWDVARSKQLALLEGHAGPVLSVALAPDGNTALSGGNDKAVRHWNLPTGKERHCFKRHANPVVHVQFVNDGRGALSASSQHQASAEQAWRRWNLTERTELGAGAAGSEHRFGCVAFSPDGRHVLAGGPGGFLRLWRW